MKKFLEFTGKATMLLTVGWLFPQTTYALTIDELSPTIKNLFSSDFSSNQTISTFLLLTALSIVPVLLIMTTSFTRIIMVLSFVRSALGTQQNPPNQVLLGLALFLTFFVMRPVYVDINQQALQPYEKNEITQAEFFEKSENRIKSFMYDQTREKDIRLFIELSDDKKEVTYKSYKDIPITIMIPAFIISELRTAFSIGFLLFLPFLIIDLVVSSILMSMGMMMLSPIMISLPFKLLLFVLVDGWYLVVESLVRSFH
ncbi:flagellar type III secretion system pore protein FliP [Enterococcus italicus]